jgi:hypothetical protein
MKYLIAVPSHDMVYAKFTWSLMELDKPQDTAFTMITNTLIYSARNMIAQNAVKYGFDRVMWFDSDMMFTPKTMKILHEDMDEILEAEMVTGVYFKRRRPHSPVILSQVEEPIVGEDGRMVGQVKEMLDYPKNGIFPVRGCGLGCCMTSVKLLKEVLDRFGPPFTPLPWAGEDLAFCYRVNQLGHTIWCDSRVKCGHIGYKTYTDEDYEGEQ